MKIYKRYIHTLLLMAAGALMMTSCQDDDLVPPSADEGDNTADEIMPGAKGDELIFEMTLDAMGGSRADTPLSIYEVENYVDPEKIRVFFFDEDENFLFESRSRSVTKIEKEGVYSRWIVSVPFYTGDNDVNEYEWDWDKIRKRLQEKSFKIALIINQPQIECFPDLDSKFEANRSFDNAGPYWTKDSTDVKKLIDLHHCQLDPIYTSKTMINSEVNNTYYDFVMGNNGSKDATRRLLMSSTSCWVDHGPNYDDNGIKDWHEDSKGKKTRCWIRPTKEYPIPMYGIQNFPKITKWSPGTPFNLSLITDDQRADYGYQTISLLRSVVKLELLIPKDKCPNEKLPEYISLRYSNIYARVLPMDIWTPTKDLWDKYEPTETSVIMNHGGFARQKSQWKGGYTTSLEEYRYLTSWLFGCWSENDPTNKPRWNFTQKMNGIGKLEPAASGSRYPRIFNPCVQRNGIVACDSRTDFSADYNDDYFHIIVYTGERNVNDPSKLGEIDTNTSGAPTVIYWMFEINKQLYAVPFVDPLTYGGAETIPITKNESGVSQTYDPNAKADPNSYINKFELQIHNSPQELKYMPLPLIRNHVYRIRVGVPKNPSRSDSDELTYSIEELHSETI